MAWDYERSKADLLAKYGEPDTGEEQTDEPMGESETWRPVASEEDKAALLKHHGVSYANKVAGAAAASLNEYGANLVGATAGIIHAFGAEIATGHDPFNIMMAQSRDPDWEEKDRAREDLVLRADKWATDNAGGAIAGPVMEVLSGKHMEDTPDAEWRKERWAAPRPEQNQSTRPGTFGGDVAYAKVLGEWENRMGKYGDVQFSEELMNDPNVPDETKRAALFKALSDPDYREAMRTARNENIANEAEAERIAATGAIPDAVRLTNAAELYSKAREDYRATTKANDESALRHVAAGIRTQFAVADAIEKAGTHVYDTLSAPASAVAQRAGGHGWKSVGIQEARDSARASMEDDPYSFSTMILSAADNVGPLAGSIGQSLADTYGSKVMAGGAATGNPYAVAGGAGLKALGLWLGSGMIAMEQRGYIEEARRLGIPDEYAAVDSQEYGVLSGIVENHEQNMNKALLGLPAKAAKGTGGIAQWLLTKGVKNAAARQFVTWAGKQALSAAGEAGEEVVQKMLQDYKMKHSIEKYCKANRIDLNGWMAEHKNDNLPYTVSEDGKELLYDAKKSLKETGREAFAGFGAALVYGGIGGARSAAHYTRADSVANEVLGDRLGMDKKMLRQYSPEVKGDVIAVLASVDAADAKDIENSRQLLDKMDERDGTHGQHRQLFDKILHEVQLDEAATKNFKSNFVMPFVEDGGRREVKWETGTDDAGHDVFYVESDGIRIEKRVGVDEALQRQVDALPDGPEKTRLQRRISNADTGYYVRDLVHGTTRQAGSASNAYATARLLSSRNQMLASQREAKTRLVNGAFQRIVGDVQPKVFNTFGEMAAAYAQDQKENLENGTGYDPSNPFVTGADGTVYVALDNMATPMDGVKAALHEGGVHNGMRAWLEKPGNTQTAVEYLNSIGFPIESDLQKLRNRGFSEDSIVFRLNANLNRLQTREGGGYGRVRRTDAQGNMLPADEIKAKEAAARAELIEEAFAYTAENVATPSLRQKMTNGLRNLVRSALGRNLQLTDSDLAVMMQDWRDSARRPKPKVETPAPAPSPAPGSASADTGATTTPSASTATPEGPSAPSAAASAPEVVSTTEDVQRWLGENGIDLTGTVTEDLQAIAQRIESEGGERSGELLRQFSSLTETPLDTLLPGRAKAEPAAEAKPAKEKKPKAAPKKKETAPKKEAAKEPTKPKAETTKPANPQPPKETKNEKAKAVPDEAPSPTDRGAQPAAGTEAQRVEGSAAPRGEAGEVKSNDGIVSSFGVFVNGIKDASKARLAEKGRSVDFKKDGDGARLFKEQHPDWVENDNGNGTIFFTPPVTTEATAPKAEAPKPRKALAPKPKTEEAKKPAEATAEKPKALAPKAKPAEAQKPAEPAKTEAKPKALAPKPKTEAEKPAAPKAEAKPAEKPAETPKPTEAKPAPKATESPAPQPAASLSPYEQIVADRYNSYHATEAYAADNGDFALKVERDGKTRWLQFTAGGDLVVHNDGSANWQATKARRYGMKMDVAQQATSVAQVEAKPAPKVEAVKAEAPKAEAPKVEAAKPAAEAKEAPKPTEAKPRKALVKKEAPATKAEAQPQTNNTKRKSDEAPAAKTTPETARNAVPEEPSLKPVERSKPMRSKTEKRMTGQVRGNRVRQLKGILAARNEAPVTPELFRKGASTKGLNPKGLVLEYLKDFYDDPTDWHMELGLPRAEAEAVRDAVRTAYEDSYISRSRGSDLGVRGGYPGVMPKIIYAENNPDNMRALALARLVVTEAADEAGNADDQLGRDILENRLIRVMQMVSALPQDMQRKEAQEERNWQKRLSKKELKNRVSTETAEGETLDIAVEDNVADKVDERFAQAELLGDRSSDEAQTKDFAAGIDAGMAVRDDNAEAPGREGRLSGGDRSQSTGGNRIMTVTGVDGDTISLQQRNTDGDVVQDVTVTRGQLAQLAEISPETWGAIASDPKPGMSVRFRRSTLDSSANSDYNNRVRNLLDELQTLRGDESVARSTDFLNSLLRSINEQERANDGRGANDDGRGAGQRVLRAYIQAIGRMGGPARAAAAIGILARTIETLEGASRDSGGSGQRTAGPARTDGRRRLLAAQTKALEAWARNNKRWAGNATAWAKRNYDYLGYGSRSEVYFDEARKRVVKLTDIGYADVMTGLDSVALFNLTADDSNRYSLIGFGKRGDTFCAILSQPFIDSADVDREATKRLTPSDLERHFNERLGRYGISVERTGDRNFLFENADFEIADAIPGDNAVVLKADEDGETANVARMKNGRIVVLDADIEFKRDAKEALASAVSGARFMRAGVSGAKRLNIDGGLDAARHMERDGASREDIWRKTGWWRGKDGKWRIEIPDLNVYDEFFDELTNTIRTIGDDQHVNVPLSRVGDNRMLLRAYPALKKIGVFFGSKINEELGDTIAAYAPDTRNIAVNTNYVRSRQDLRRALVHEVQHAIQYLEGMAHGTDPTYESNEASRENGPLSDDIQALYAESQNIPEDKWTPEQKKARDFVQFYAQSLEDEGWNRYERSAGEVEARNVEARLNMTPEERATIPPWEMEDVSEADQIVRVDKPGARFMRAGVRGAERLGITNLANAERMEKEGAGRTEIWKKTGWWRAKDGKWRVEIPDISIPKWKAEWLKEQGRIYPDRQYKLGEIVSSAELFAAYPELKDMPLQVTALADALAAYEGREKGILLERDIRADKMASVLTHEIQHAIQDLESLARGGNQHEAQKIIDAESDARRNERQESLKSYRAAMSQAGYDTWIQDKAELVRELYASLGADRYQDAVLRAFLDTLQPSVREKVESAKERYDSSLADDVPKQNAYEVYRSFAGEVEARDAQTRLNMTPEERAATPPWETEDVPEDRQIVRFRRQIVTPEQDAAYMDAVNRGDMETAARMVREAAARAMPNTKVIGEDGLPKVVWHGTYQNDATTGRSFTKFIPKGDTGGSGVEIYFTDNPGVASFFSGGGEVLFYSPKEILSRIDKNDERALVSFIKEVGKYDDAHVERLSDDNIRLSLKYKDGGSSSTPLLGGFGKYKKTDYLESLYGEALLEAERAEEHMPGKGKVINDWTTDYRDRSPTGGVYSCYLNIRNPLVVDAQGGTFDNFMFNGKPSDMGSISQFAKRRGYDGAIVRNIHETTLEPSGANLGTNYIVFDSSQIKTADAITADDAGNVIPLSERFNEANPDIRFRRASKEELSANAKTEAQRVLDLIGGTELGNAINHDFKEDGRTTIIGQTISTADDLAVAAQVYRNPAFETMRYFFTKNGKVVWQTSITAHKPDATPIAEGESMNVSKTFSEFNRMANTLRPDGLWVLHNHPSGDVNPSQKDIKVSSWLNKIHEGKPIAYHGQVVIDHNKYSFIPAGSETPQIFERDFSGSTASFHGDPTDNHSLENPVLGSSVNDPDTARVVADMAMRGQDAATRPGEALTLIATSAKSEVRSVATIPTEEVLGLLADGTLEDYAAAVGGSSLFLVGDIDYQQYPDNIQTRLIEMCTNGTIRDFIFEDGSAWQRRLFIPRTLSSRRFARRVAESSGPRFRRATDTIATRGPISSVESILASRATAPTATTGLMDRTETFMDRVRRNAQDAMLPVKSIEDELHVAPKDSVYLAEDARYGKDEHQTRELLNNTINPIIDEAQRRNVALSDVSAYLLAKHAAERNLMIRDRTAGVMDDGAGISDQQAKDILKAYDDAGMTANLDAVAQMVWAMNRATLDRLVSAGLLAEKQANKWKELSEHYVPLRTMLEEDDDRSVSAAITRLESKHALGRSSLPSSPLIFSFLQAEQAIARANKNAVRQKLAALVRAHPEMGRVISEQPRTRALINGQVKYVKDKGFTEKRSLKDNGRANVVQFKEGGDLKYIELKGERGELIARAVTKYGMHNLESGIGKLAMDINRWLANTRTSWAPSFLLRNVGYDTQQVLVLMNGDGLHKESAAYLKNLAGGRAFKTALNYFKDGTFKGELADSMKEYVENGGLIKGGTSQGWGETVDLIDERVAELERKGASEKARKVMGKLATANSAVEVQTRLAVYAAMRAAGHGIEESIAYSRDITVNFNRKGEYGQLINTMFMFANASIQDMERIGRTLFGKEASRYGKNSKAALARTIGTLVALGFMQGLANYLGGDDDDDEDMANISEYNKQSAWNLKLGKFGMYARLGRRGAYALLPYLGTKLAEVFCGKAKAGDASLDIAEYAFGLALDPLNSSVIMRGEDGRSVAIADSVANALSPTLIAPLTQIVTDRTFTGEKLTKNKWDRNLPNANNGRERTASPYKALARGINAATGGDDFTAGFIDPSPEVLELLLTSIWGGLGSDVIRTGGTAIDIFNERTIHGQRTPFLRDFARNVPDNTSRYYEAIARQSRYETSVKGYRDSRDHDKLRAFVKEHPSASHDKTKKLEGIKKQIKELRELETRREGEPLERTRELRRKLQGKYIDMVGD